MSIPRTTHDLPESPLANLIRSTRKLGDMLGETPQIDDPYRPSASRAPSPASSISSTESERFARFFESEPHASSFAGSDRTTTRPKLHLHLTPPSPAPGAAYPSPTSPGFSPLTPTFAPVNKRKFAQNPPPELVFSVPPKSKSTRDMRDYIPSPVLVPAMLSALGPTPRGRASSLSAPSTRPSYSREDAMSSRNMSSMGYYGGSRSPVSPSSPGGPWAAPTPTPPSYAQAPRSPHYIKRSQLLSSTTPDVSRHPWDDDATSRRAASHARPDKHAPPAPSAEWHPSTTSRSTDDARFLSRTFVFEPPRPAYASSSHSSNSGSSGSSGYSREREYERDGHLDAGSTHRREQGWSGEWSGAAGMADVVQSLRGLRM
ncbi:hypothetical protein DFH07DRAFT_819004, partial [Mycena maculata]